MIIKKRIFLVILCFLFCTINNLFAQVSVLPEKENGKKKSYPINGSHLLIKENEKVNKYLSEHPEAIEKIKLQKKSDWGFTVGSTKQWYAIDFTSSNYDKYLTKSTCRSVGKYCYIFVEDSLWGNRVTQSAIDSVRIAFDEKTPADASKGIYMTDIETFGNPPDIDNDPRIIILILNIKDGYIGEGGFVTGYFYSGNEISGNNSNQSEIYFLDANPVNLKTSTGINLAMSTTTHEFQHMIHWNYLKNQTTFINEGCSLVSEVICGYPIHSQTEYIGETNHYLLDWRSNDNDKVLNDYSRAARFFLYLRDQFGVGFFRFILQSGIGDLGGLTYALQKVGSSLSFEDVFRNWTIANVINDRTNNPAFGYIYPNLPSVTPTLNASPEIVVTNDKVEKLAVKYLLYKHGSKLRITFNFNNSSLIIKEIRKKSDGYEILDIQSGVEINEPEYGTTYKEIYFLIINTNKYNSQSYSYSSSGEVASAELKWDETEPIGYYQLSNRDTACVNFDAVPGGRLDSIKVAFRRAGSLTGGIWRSTGVQKPSPLGNGLKVPITATSTIQTEPPVPYPVPWPNWAKVDLRSYKISTDLPFSVGFIIGSDYKFPGLMATKVIGSGAYHSYVYLNQPNSGGSAGWYYLSNGADSVVIWLIRAYVGFSNETIVLEPDTYSLGQNYPNPFNSATTIEFDLQEPTFVKLTVYNILGHEVGTIIESNLTLGKHKVIWDAKSVYGALPSGIYFYRIETSKFSETKKLVLIR